MTAEPDALRLVPARATRKQLEDAAFNLSAEIGPDEALKLAPHIERAYELLVAAAPAVQPAGREGLEDIIDGLRSTLARPDCQFLRIERSGAQRILAALSQPGPASEGDAR